MKNVVLRMVRLRPPVAINLLDIVQVEGAAQYCIVRLVNGSQLKIAIPLSGMASRLPELVRIHRRYLINLTYVELVYRHRNMLKLVTGQQLPLARRRRSQVLERLSFQFASQSPIMSQDTPTISPEIVPVAAIRLAKEGVPNRSQRNAIYTELGSLNLPDGKVRCYAHRRAGSLLLVMPDATGFSIEIDTVATQCYKYWKLTTPGEQQEPDAADPTPIDVTLEDPVQ